MRRYDKNSSALTNFVKTRRNRSYWLRAISTIFTLMFAESEYPMVPIIFFAIVIATSYIFIPFDEIDEDFTEVPGKEELVARYPDVSSQIDDLELHNFSEYFRLLNAAAYPKQKQAIAALVRGMARSRSSELVRLQMAVENPVFLRESHVGRMEDLFSSLTGRKCDINSMTSFNGCIIYPDNFEKLKNYGEITSAMLSFATLLVSGVYAYFEGGNYKREGIESSYAFGISSILFASLIYRLSFYYYKSNYIKMVLILKKIINGDCSPTKGSEFPSATVGGRLKNVFQMNWDLGLTFLANSFFVFHFYKNSFGRIAGHVGLFMTHCITPIKKSESKNIQRLYIIPVILFMIGIAFAYSAENAHLKNLLFSVGVATSALFQSLNNHISVTNMTKRKHTILMNYMLFELFKMNPVYYPIPDLPMGGSVHDLIIRSSRMAPYERMLRDSKDPVLLKRRKKIVEDSYDVLLDPNETNLANQILSRTLKEKLNTLLLHPVSRVRMDGYAIILKYLGYELYPTPRSEKEFISRINIAASIFYKYSNNERYPFSDSSKQVVDIWDVYRRCTLE